MIAIVSVDSVCTIALATVTGEFGERNSALSVRGRPVFAPGQV